MSLTTSPFLLPQQQPPGSHAAEFRYFVYLQSQSAGLEEERLHFFPVALKKGFS